MDLKLAALNIAPPTNAGGIKPAVATAGAQSSGKPAFSSALDSALKAVSQAQTESSQLQQQFQMGNPNVTLEQTMVAMQKSQIGFQAAITVRNRLVSAYTDIMNMSV
jgi:flagellar hook-basal body complex protein FliE